jgi:hypothetical protein
MISSRLLTAALTTLAIAASASAVTFTTDFDSGSFDATTFANGDFSFHNGVYTTLEDNDGPIDGSNQWQIDTDSDAANGVVVSDPTLRNYGTAPSVSYALNAVDQSVLIVFNEAVDITGFSVTLDNSTFGNPFASSIDFVNGATVSYSETINQFTPGLVVNVGSAFNVKSIALPGGAYYDNLSFTYAATAIPEPSTYAALVGAAGLALAITRRRRQK